jgi:hypothetical protein
VVEARHVVADVPHAIAVLDAARPLTWVGPRHLHVIVVA